MSDLTEIYKYLLEVDTPSLSDILKSKIEELGLSQRQTSQILGLQRTTLQRILENEAQKIDVLTFLKIRNFLESDLIDFTRLFVSTMDSEEIKQLEYVRKAVIILRNFDLKSLYKIGFINDQNDFEAIEKRILDYFGFTYIEEYEKSVQTLLSQSNRNFNDTSRKLWLKSVETAFKLLDNPHPYNRELFQKMVERIPGYSRKEENGLLTVIKALFKAGVTVIYQPYPHNTQIRGASFVIKGKPFIVLTDYNKRYDTIWWALMHEIYHVLYDFDTLQSSIFHLSGEEDIFLMENNANDYASTKLLSAEKYNSIAPFINIPEMVERQAEIWNIHASIIYGRYMFNNKGSEMKYRGLIPNTTKATKNINYNLLQSESIAKTVNSIKQNIFEYE
jgi:HTH-type transcriptional regulator/antitoxin HigA